MTRSVQNLLLCSWEGLDRWNNSSIPLEHSLLEWPLPRFLMLDIKHDNLINILSAHMRVCVCVLGGAEYRKFFCISVATGLNLEPYASTVTGWDRVRKEIQRVWKVAQVGQAFYTQTISYYKYNASEQAMQMWFWKFFIFFVETKQCIHCIWLKRGRLGQNKPFDLKKRLFKDTIHALVRLVRAENTPWICWQFNFSLLCWHLTFFHQLNAGSPGTGDHFTAFCVWLWDVSVW